MVWILTELQKSLLWFVFSFSLRPRQELEHQKKQPQVPGDKFVSVVSQFITVASFSFSDVEDSLGEAKDLVSAARRHHLRWHLVKALHIHMASCHRSCVDVAL